MVPLPSARSLIRLAGMKRAIIAALLLLFPLSARAETPEEWIALGARVHGAFGAFIPLGIKIGLDAVKRLSQGRVSWCMDLGWLKLMAFDGNRNCCCLLSEQRTAVEQDRHW